MTKAPAAHPTSYSKAWRHAVLSAKLALVVLIALISWSNLQAVLGISESLAWKPKESLEDQLPAVPAAATFTAGFGDGLWQMEGFPWRLRITAVGQSQLDQTFEALPAAPTEFAELTAEERTDQDAVLAMFKRNSPVSERHGDLLVYRSQQEHCRSLVVCVGPPDDERLLAARYAWDAGENWRVIEALPRVRRETLDTPALTDEAVLLATKFDQSGRVASQMVTCPSDAEQVATSWTQSGWKVVRAPDTSSLEGGTRMYVTRGRGAYLADFLQSQDGATSLVLTAAEP